MFEKLLIANRGEIALRVIRACRELGIEPVAVYSEADRLAPHVLHSSEAYLLGPAPSAESYLRGDVLIEVARRSGCDAIHPGYGFLAERAEFAKAVEDAGLVFVGPSSEAIAAMGDKTEARRRMRSAGVPVVPGTADALTDSAEAEERAEDIGLPVLLKAAAGGGGKGMRVVRKMDGVGSAFEAATREAQAAFGDGSIYIEKYLEGPRHIEIQVLADAHGHTIHLAERECSIQRRHQKLIEEAPSAVLTPELRSEMGAAAVAAAEAVGYRSAGTVEFLYDDGEFYFLEMNTRLQVEHPVTELVTGLDLVHWQLRIAAGESLPMAQEDVGLSGHAVECRITSESSASGFLPSTGTIDLLMVPSGPGVRWDGGIELGSEVTLHYDPLLGKLIVHGRDRSTALDRMRRALRELRIGGVDTSTSFHLRVMDEPDFRTGAIDINYLEKHPDVLQPEPAVEMLEAAAVAGVLLEHGERHRRAVGRIDDVAAASRGGGWRDIGWRG